MERKEQVEASLKGKNSNGVLPLLAQVINLQAITGQWTLNIKRVDQRISKNSISLLMMIPSQILINPNQKTREITAEANAGHCSLLSRWLHQFKNRREQQAAFLLSSSRQIRRPEKWFSTRNRNRLFSVLRCRPSSKILQGPSSISTMNLVKMEEAQLSARPREARNQAKEDQVKEPRWTWKAVSDPNSKLISIQTPETTKQTTSQTINKGINHKIKDYMKNLKINKLLHIKHINRKHKEIKVVETMNK